MESGHISKKKVRFAAIPIVHLQYKWLFAYRNARNGRMWIESAVDRERFQRRITQAKQNLDQVLSQKIQEMYI